MVHARALVAGSRQGACTGPRVECRGGGVDFRVALVAIGSTQRAAYALASWVPPLLFVPSIARLKSFLPVLMSGVGATAHLLSYWLFLRRAPLLGYLDEPMVIVMARALAAEGRSLRAVSDELAVRGHVARSGRLFAASAVGAMLAA